MSKPLTVEQMIAKSFVEAPISISAWGDKGLRVLAKCARRFVRMEEKQKDSSVKRIRSNTLCGKCDNKINCGCYGNSVIECTGFSHKY